MKKIKTSRLSRSLALANLSLKSGAKYAKGWVKNRGRHPEQDDEIWGAQAELFTREVSKLKGPLMKIGQMMSTFGKGIIPDEVIKSMAVLQSDSEPLEWKSIEKTLQKELNPEILNELDIEEEPYAAASLGQVHLAKVKATGERVCMKIQYPGVDKAIETDLKALRRILIGAGFITKEEGFDDILREVKEMLETEVDYNKERETTKLYYRLFEKDRRIRIPRVYDRYSTSRIMVTEFVPGEKIESEAVKSLTQKRRDQIGHAMMDHYLLEFFEFKHVQTDPHFGNYAIKIDQDGDQDQLVMYDFGALRKIPEEFHVHYVELLQGAYQRDYDRSLQASIDIGILRDDDPDFIKHLHVFVFFLVMEGFMPPDDERVKREFFDKDGNYDWGETDLLLRATSEASKFAKKGFFRPPPKEFIFINRKTVGVFNFLHKVGCKINSNSKIKKYIDS